MRRLVALTLLGICCTACSGETGPKGDPGVPGATGPTGPSGQTVSLTTLPVGDASCGQGGTAITAGGATGWACNGAPGVQHLRVLDGDGVELGTLVGTSLVWATQAGGSVAPIAQVVSYLDLDGNFWNVGVGGGAVQLVSVALYFESADCSGAPLVRNMSPQVAVSVQTAGPSQGVYRAGDVAAGASPLSWLPTGTSVCTTSAPAPNPAPNPTTYRSATRLGDYPPAPRVAPITIAP